MILHGTIYNNLNLICVKIVISLIIIIKICVNSFAATAGGSTAVESSPQESIKPTAASVLGGSANPLSLKTSILLAAMYALVTDVEVTAAVGEISFVHHRV